MTAKPRQPHRWSAILAAGALFAAAGGLSTGASAETINKATLTELIADLSAPVFATREAATNRLESLEGPVEAMVSKHLKSATNNLTQEQLSRIESVLEYRFNASPRAALGVGFAPPAQAGVGQGQIAVTLSEVRQGFPCAKTLMPGDIIRVVDGYELPPTGGGDHVRTAILSHLPGEELELVIERDGSRSFFRVPLGDYARLSNAVPSAALVKAGWARRKARIGLTTAEYNNPLTCVADGGRGEMPALPKRDQPDVEAGGAPDNGAAMLHLLRSRASTLSANHIAATNNGNRIQVRNAGQPPKMIDRRQVERESPAVQRARLQSLQARALKDRERYIKIAERNDVGQQQKQTALANLAQVEARLAAIQAQLSELDGKINPRPDDED